MLQASWKWKWMEYLFSLWYRYILFSFNYKKYMKGVVAEGGLQINVFKIGAGYTAQRYRIVA